MNVLDLLVRTIDALGKLSKKTTVPQGIYVWNGLLDLNELLLEVCEGMFLGLPFVQTS